MRRFKIFCIVICILTFCVAVSILVACKNNSNQNENIEYEVNYIASDGGYIDGEISQRVKKNKDATPVAAIANEGYKFVKWSDGITTSERQETNVTEDISVTAEFAPLKYYTLTYTAETGGHIEGETEQSVLELTSGATVTAIANEGYKFVKWSDGITTAERRDANVSEDKSVTAKFAPLEYYTLKYIASAGGYIDGDTEQTILELGNGTRVRAVAEDGYTFSGWSDGLMSASRQDTLVDENKEITAYFDRLPTYKLTYSTNSSYGYIQGEAVQNVIEGRNGTTVTAMSSSEYWAFYLWSDGVNTPSRRDVNVTSDKEIVAYYRKVIFTYEYTVASAESGRIEGEAIQRVKRGDSGTEVTAVPNEGYFFSAWSDTLNTPTRVDSKQQDLKFTAYFVKGLEVNYRVNNAIGGHIEGEAKQYVRKDSDTTSVKAVAEEGYVFAGWSDGIATAERSDKNLQSDFTMTAYFEPEEKVFHYNYCGATSNVSIKKVTVTRNNPQLSKFVVPQKSGYEFVGWYADADYKMRVTDEDGKLMYGYNTVTLETDTLYARWADPEDETVVFKILLIVVEEIDATLKLREDYTLSKHVQYKLTMSERILCKQIAGRMSDYLNSWFKGNVEFEIDTYFTMQIVDTEDFYYNHFFLDPFYMKEVKHLYDKYDSLLTLYDINDYNNVITEPGVSGIGTYKRGCVYLEKTLMNQLKNASIADKVMQGDETVESRWSYLLDTCLHEFTHTVEMRYKMGELYDYDVAIIDLYYSGIHDYIEITRRYLLCEAEINGTKVGIPSVFWTDKLWRYESNLKQMGN